MTLRRSLVGPAMVTLAGLLLWHRGREVAALTAFVVAVALLHAVLFSERARDAIHRAERAVASAASTVVGFVLLFPLFILVSVPSWLWAHRPGGRRRARAAAAAGLWQPRPDEPRLRPKRPYAAERAPVGPTVGRRRIVLRTVACVVLVEVIAVGGVVVIRNRQAPVPVERGVSSISAANAPAVKDLPWHDQAEQDLGNVSSQLVYSPFTGASLRDYSSRYVNVHNRVRKSYETPLAQAQKPIEIWCFGGSTMFGFDLQRDLHTIPSELVRLAEQDGIAVHVRNFGSPGYVNYQETMELALLLSGGERPDLVLFYDGINDSSLQLANDFGQVNLRGEPAELGSHQQRKALAGSGIIPGGTDALPSPLVPSKRTGRVTADGLVADIVDVYDQGVEISRTLSQKYGFPVYHFWQPDIYSKRVLDPGESVLLPGLGLDGPQFQTMQGLSRHVRAALPPGVIDISDALDTAKGPVLTDMVHINEVGGQAVAEAMYRHLHPELVRLHDAR